MNKKIFLLVFLCGIFLSGCTKNLNSSSILPINSFTDQQKSDLLSFAYNKKSFPKELAQATNAIVAVLRDHGKKVGAAYTDGYSLEMNLQHAIDQAISNGSIDRTTLGSLSIHLHLLDKRIPYDTSYLLGGDTTMIRNSAKDSVYRGSYAIEANKNEQDIRTSLCKNLGLPKECTTQEGVEYLYAHELHFARDSEGKVINYMRGKQLAEGITFDATQLQDVLLNAKNWLVSNLDAKGKFTYIYDPTSSTYASSNNLIRQFMSSRELAQLSQNDESLRPLHQRNLDYIFATRYKEDDRDGRVVYEGTSKLGAIAMLLRTLSESPFYDQYAKQAEKLATTILDLQNPDGSLEPRWIEPTYKYDKDYLLTFYSGEGIVALLDYYKKTNQQRRLDAAIKSQNYYIDRYVTHIDEHYYPAYVPRHTISLNKLFLLTKDMRYAQAIFTLNDKLIDEMLHTSTMEGPKDIIGRFYNPNFSQYGSPHSSSDAVYVEGLAYAYEIAQAVGDTGHQQKYHDAIELGLHNLFNLQYNVADTYFVEHPERVLGALRYNVTDNRIRTDTTQHALDAMTKIEELFSKGFIQE